VLHPQFAGEPGLSRIYHDIEMPVRQVIWQIERNGILVDAEVLARQSHEMGQKIMALEAQAYELAGQPFNLASPKQLADILFEKQGLPVKKKTPPAARPPTRKCSPNWRWTTRCPSCCSNTAACPN
jgi:DNA polymerase-1